MSYNKQIIDEIKQRLQLSDIVGQQVQLQKKGSQYVGLSPFNKEKTPSFFVNDDKGFYHCFSSQKSGDVFSFIMETQGVDFNEALKQAADIAGLQLQKYQPDNSQDNDHIQRLYRALDIAKEYFQQQLKIDGHKTVQDYLKKRHITQQSIDLFQLGYASQNTRALKNHLVKNGVQLRDAVTAGLIIDKQNQHGDDKQNYENSQDTKDSYYDRFRQRLIFPIEDPQGRCIGFGARNLVENRQAKYLNSPETPLFKKSKNLYNLKNAKAAARKKNRIIVAEGYIDVISMVRAGLPETVASLGTAVSVDQLKIIWKIVPEPIFCFDADETGKKAAIRLIFNALKFISIKNTISFVSLADDNNSQNLDPDSYINQYGAEKIQQKMQQKINVADYIWDNYLLTMSNNTPEQRAYCENEAKNIVELIEDQYVKKHYKKEFYIRFKKLWWQQDSIKLQNNTQIQKKYSHDKIPLLKYNNFSVLKNQQRKYDNETMLFKIITDKNQLLEEHIEVLSQLKWESKTISIALDENIKNINERNSEQNQSIKENRKEIHQDFSYLLLLQQMGTLQYNIEQEQQKSLDDPDNTDFDEISAMRKEIKQMLKIIKKWREKQENAEVKQQNIMTVKQFDTV